LSDQNILTNVAGSRQLMRLGDEVLLAVLPLFHSYGLTATLMLQIAHCSTVVLHERFAPRSVLQAIAEYRVTAFFAVASHFRLLLKEPSAADLSSLRICIAGAERLPEQLAADFQARFSVPLLQGYGVTETSPVIAINVPWANHPASVGSPLPNIRVSIRDENLRELPAGQTGEISVEGPNVMLGYYNRPEATAEKIVNGVLRTGDLGFLDADGYLYVAGRADDLVKMAGEKVYPAEVERAIEAAEGVEEAAVLPVRDEKRGFQLRAFVVARPGAQLSEAALREACRRRLEACKLPASFTFVEQLPHGPSGKLDKRALAAAFDLA
jgi:long-chain acyl-CoA synthetase